MTVLHVTLPEAEFSDGQQLLPAPPTNREKDSYQFRQVPLLILISVVSLGCLTMSQIHFVRLRPELWALIPFLVFTLAYYLISLRVNVASRDFDLTAHRMLVDDWAPAQYPSVDVFLPICGEPLGVLNNTWRHVQAMVRRYPGDTNVYVLDDGDNAHAGALAGIYGFIHTVRPNRGWFKKAGNLRHGYQSSRGEYVVIFDADFAPRPDFLFETLPYLDRDRRLAIVQTPQFFRADPRQTWMERGAGAVQELFYRVVQVSRDQLGGAICVGSCAVYRRAALNDIGGTTLIEHSEDVHTGFDLVRAGWALKYIPVPLATGLCPADPDSFLTQQYRWCSGSMSLLGSHKFWHTKMRASTRCCFLSGFCYYIHTAISTFVVPLIPILLLVLLPRHVQLHNYLWIIPSTTYTLLVFPLWNQGRYGPTAMMAKNLYGWAHAFAIIDILRRRQMGWQTTGAKAGKKSSTQRMWRAITIWSGGTGLVWVGLAGYRMLTLTPINFVFLFAAGMFYFWLTVMTLLARRQAKRREPDGPSARTRTPLPPTG